LVDVDDLHALGRGGRGGRLDGIQEVPPVPGDGESPRSTAGRKDAGQAGRRTVLLDDRDPGGRPAHRRKDVAATWGRGNGKGRPRQGELLKSRIDRLRRSKGWSAQERAGGENAEE